MVEMMRFRFGEKGESIDLHGVVDLADALMLLSRSKEDAPPVNHHRRKRVFECKTCSKRFSSFQALGGHRTSHKKPRLSGNDDRDQAQSGTMSKSKAHECSICGLEFALGQALGGHMRRHRASGDRGFGRGLANKSSIGKREFWSDLNLQRGSVVDTELRLGLGLGLEHKDRTPTAVDFFH